MPPLQRQRSEPLPSGMAVRATSSIFLSLPSPSSLWCDGSTLSELPKLQRKKRRWPRRLLLQSIVRIACLRYRSRLSAAPTVRQTYLARNKC